MKLKFKLIGEVRRHGKKGLLLLAGLPLALLVGGGALAFYFGGGFGPSTSNQTSSINLNQGLVGWWRMNGNAKDSTPYHHTGTVSSATLTTDRFGNANSAYSFAGTSGSYISISNPLNQAATSEVWTVTAWVNLPAASPNASQYMISGMNNGLFLNYSTNNKMLLYLNGGTNDYYMYGTHSLRDGNWHFVTYAFRNSDGFRKVYIDGVDDSSSGPNNTSTPSGLGSTFNIGQNTQGSISDVRIYNRVLSQAEITALYKSTNASTKAAQGENGLVGWWKMQGNAKDSSAYKDNGTLYNSPTLTTDRNGTANSAYSFNGTNQWFRLPNNTILDPGTGSMSWSAWFNTSSVSNSPMIYRKSDGCNDNGFILELNASGTVEGYLTYYSGGTGCSGSSVSASVTSPGTYADGKWHLATVVLNRSTSTLILYMDGQQVISGSAASISGVNMVAGNYPSIASSYGGNNFFNGSLSDIRVYNRALSATDISNLYNSYNSEIGVGGVPGSGVNLAQGLIGEWGFNGNPKDSTPYHNNGTLVNAPSLTTDRNGRTNSAYSLNGTNQYINAGTVSQFNSQSSFTWNSWVNLNSFTNPSSNCGDQRTYIMSKYTGGVFDELLAQGTGNKFYFRIYGGTPYPAAVASGFNTNQWYMVTGIYNSQAATVALYVNGVLQQSVSSSGDTIPNTSAGNLQFGYNSYNCTNGYVNGTLDDTRVWSRALSQAEITALYNEYQ